MRQAVWTHFRERGTLPSQSTPDSRIQKVVGYISPYPADTQLLCPVSGVPCCYHTSRIEVQVTTESESTDSEGNTTTSTTTSWQPRINVENKVTCVLTDTKSNSSLGVTDIYVEIAQLQKQHILKYSAPNQAQQVAFLQQYNMATSGGRVVELYIPVLEKVAMIGIIQRFDAVPIMPSGPTKTIMPVIDSKTASIDGNEKVGNWMVKGFGKKGIVCTVDLMELNLVAVGGQKVVPYNSNDSTTF